MSNSDKPQHPTVEYDQPVDTEALRPHVFDDNIQEYDKRMPNWWLFTLYGAIVFSVGYWVVLRPWSPHSDPGAALTSEMEERTALAAQRSGDLTDDLLWKMSRDPNVVEAGKTTFLSTCAVCHQPDLSGKIGPSLLKETWIHGGQPLQIISTITNGVPAKGMPTWGPVLGKSKIAEAAAFILSHHKRPAAGDENKPSAEATPPASTPNTVVSAAANPPTASGTAIPASIANLPTTKP